MPLTISTKTYNSDRIAPDAVLYTGPANTLTVIDSVELRRVYPKPVKGNAGVARPSFKTVKTVTLADGVTTANVIATTSFSLPVGVADADVTSLIADHGAVLSLEAAGTTALVKKLDIHY